MSTNPPNVSPAILDDPVLREADIAAVLKNLTSGEPLTPAVADRVHARAVRVTEDIRREHRVIDDEAFESLLDDEA